MIIKWAALCLPYLCEEISSHQVLLLLATFQSHQRGYTDWRLSFLCNHALLDRAKNAVRILFATVCNSLLALAPHFPSHWYHGVRIGKRPALLGLLSLLLPVDDHIMLSWEGVTVSFPPSDSLWSFITWSVSHSRNYRPDFVHGSGS